MTAAAPRQLSSLRPTPARLVSVTTPVGDWDYTTIEPIWSALTPGEWAPATRPEPPPGTGASASRVPPYTRPPSPEHALDLLAAIYAARKARQTNKAHPANMGGTWWDHVVLDEPNVRIPPKPPRTRATRRRRRR